MADDIGGDIADDEIELLIGGLSDDIAFVWALIHLGLRRNDGTDETPSVETVDAAFAHFGRLLDRDLIRLGQVVHVDPNQPAGTVAPVKHVSEPIDVVRRRVLQACAAEAQDRSDWEYSCWIVTTEAGDDIARRVLERSGQNQSDAYRRWHAGNFERSTANQRLADLMAEVDDCDSEVARIVMPLQRRTDDRETVWPVIDLLAEIDGLIQHLVSFTPANGEETSSHNALVQYATEMRVVYTEALLRRTH